MIAPRVRRLFVAPWPLGVAALLAGTLGATAAVAGVIISEIHYHPAEGSAFEFVELHNDGPAPVAIEGWRFVDGIRYEFPPGADLAPGERLLVARAPDLVTELHGLSSEAVHGPYEGGLDNAGERLALEDADGVLVEDVRYDDRAPWPTAADGDGPSLERLCSRADARLATNWISGEGVGGGPSPLAPPPREVCPPPPGPSPEVAIHEIHYHPLGDLDATDEFLELTNTTERVIDLSGYRFDRGISYVFEDGTTLDPGQFLVVCRDPDAWLERHPDVPAVGGFEGQLSNDGETISLVAPDGRLVDLVRYADSGDWGATADGLGASLEKIVAAAPSNDPASWSDSASAEIRGWSSGSTTGSGTGTRIYLYANEEGEFIVDNLRLVAVGEPDTDLLVNSGFDTGLEGWEARGNHADSGWVADGGPDGSGALHLVANGRGSGTSNSLRTEIEAEIDRSGDTTYRLSLDFRHVTGNDELTLRMSGSSLSRGLYFQLGGTQVTTPGAANRVASDSVPPFVTEIRRSIREPSSEDTVSITLRPRGDGLRRVSLTWWTPDTEEVELEMADDGAAGDGAPGDGVWGASIPPLPHGTMVLYRVRAESDDSARAFPAKADPTGSYGYYVNDLRPDSPLPVYHLLLGPELGPNARTAIARLNCVTYRSASFAYRGDLYPGIGIRRRGQSVCGDPDVIKKFIKLRFQRGRDFEGLRKLNLQSLYTDKSLVRERMAWDAFAEFGNPACFHYFVRVHANGEYFGLYGALEHPDQRFLRRVGLDPAGNLYKAVASREEQNGQYEKKTNEDGDFTDLRTFLTDLHRTPSAGLAEFFEERVDPDAVIDYQAAQVLTNNRDYPHKNHYLYHDPGRDRWMPITWDMDLTYGKRWDGSFEGVLNDKMDNPGITPWYTTRVRGEGLGNHLLDKFFFQAGSWFRRAYLVRLWDAVAEKYRLEYFEEKIDGFRSLLIDEQAEDIAEWGRSRASANDPAAPAAFEPNLERVRQHIAIRRNYLLNYLRGTERFTGHDRIKITEVMFHPPGADEALEFLELWNSGDEEVDLTGWSIDGIGGVTEEGASVPFTFPDGTRVVPDEVFIVARDPETLTRLHGDVGRILGPYDGRLDNSGETLRVRDAGPGYPATVDFLRYGTSEDWPSTPDGLGPSLELTSVHADRDNDLGRYWRPSLVPGGTPGRIPRASEEMTWFRRGDSNGDGRVNITDAVVVLLWLFRGGDEPPCLDACDIDGDEGLALDDPVVLLRHLYLHDGPTIPYPGPGECGPGRDGFCAVSNCSPDAP